MYNTKPTLGMLNDEKKSIDLYIPRKCVYTNRILDSKDRSSVQLSLAQVFYEYQVDEDGKYTGKKDTYCLSGFVRAKGHAD